MYSYLNFPGCVHVRSNVFQWLLVLLHLNIILSGHVAILEWLLHHSLATGLEQDDFGATPVHDAAEQGQLQCLHVFYNHKIDLNQKDFDGFIPR